MSQDASRESDILRAARHMLDQYGQHAKWQAGARGIELVERRLVPPLGHFSLVRFRKIDVAAAA